ncbi:hypothetical protein CTAYLR_004024 [Chrysophaeum taylorii]|uniref:Methyltransferase FkbM domain-containing protein n=1 Tax=Chrysophaeum taylorii TaxID=2483200 RepID=A0AAD7UA32_9STRA|nr:hypothetical protein CTAYLR_004024 [Chrysophaeum taylorii]
MLLLFAVFAGADQQLVVPVQVAFLKEGRLPVPSDKFVVIEVGANTQNTVDETLLPLNSDTFAVTFEPLLDKYGALLARNSRPDAFSRLGFHHDRGIVLPLAIATGSPLDWRHFHVHRIDGCSSLLESPPETVVETRGVATVPLSYVLDVWLGGRVVDYLKIDAQGNDLDAIRSAGPSLANVTAVSVEVPTDDAAPAYAGELRCSAALDELEKMGLVPVGRKRMHDARFERHHFRSRAAACSWAGVAAIEILLCHWPGCVLASVQPGDPIPGVRHAQSTPT